jgi:hypothetical protein
MQLQLIATIKTNDRVAIDITVFKQLGGMDILPIDVICLLRKANPANKSQQTSQDNFFHTVPGIIRTICKKRLNKQVNISIGLFLELRQTFYFEGCRLYSKPHRI